MNGHDAGGVNSAALVALVAVGLVIAIGSFAFFKRDSSVSPPQDRHDVVSYPAAVEGLCEARRVAEDDPERAHDLFFDEAHATLHVLADEVADHDRAAAAALLEAKQKAESRSSGPQTSGETLRKDLDVLVDATVAASKAVDVEVGGCE